MPLSRSEHMARVKGENTSPEMLLRSALWRKGLRYRLKYKVPAGRPDLVFPGPKVAVTVDGCFWHGCPEHYTRPRSNSEFWSEKLRSNTERDQRLTLELEKAGWKMLRFWEHEVFRDLESVVDTIVLAVEGGSVSQGKQPRVVDVEVVNEPGGGALERRELRSLRDWDDVEFVIGPRITGKGKESKKRGGSV